MIGTLEKSDLILLLLYSRGMKGQSSESIQGITRLMKLLFLLDREEGINDKFSFAPYKMGPFSSEVYPELEFLRNFPDPEHPLVKGIAKRTGQSTEISPEQIKYIDDIQFEEIPPDNSEVDVEFKLTDIGEAVAKELWGELDSKSRNSIEAIKVRYGNWPLRQLLKYVYENYPDMTVNSEIKHQVLK
ncbi:MAG: hypothetical protein ACD_81C00100G0011 [uncultured bacterium]|uniref:Antitoxin SocA-like Panacea domain-containing protein n=1 Tax=Candidatus Wolfebacteria bacterium GW2011_GWE2_44_13 TaxID=1619017 RepID=A0A0G1K560_9BACT|nr:MAG: hypothetical protein ACD_81C00100G0011 [uncultured bacterium]KKT42989.1 MAG: hypothetical protein UW32_C0003G0092 [Candidatus Wolfebacteria bacterium GW2011_GWE2_44_13]